MDYTVWHDSSDPQVNMEHQNPAYINDETLNSSFENDWNLMNYQQSHASGSLHDTSPRNYYDGNFTENWEDDFTNLGGDSLDDTTMLSLAKHPIDSMANAPIHGDSLGYRNANGSDSQVLGLGTNDADAPQKPDSQHFPPQDQQTQQEMQSPERASLHRRGYSDAFSMKVPLVKPSHNDAPAPNSRSNLTQLDTSFIGNDDLGIDIFGDNSELAAGPQFSSSNFSPNLASNAFQTPSRLPPGSAGGAGNRQSPTLARDSPGAYLGKGLESPMEFNGLESPYLSYQPFPVLPNQSSKAGGRRKASSLGSTRTRRTSSSASQKSLSVGSNHDALEQPGSPRSRATSIAASAHKPLAGTNNIPAQATTPRALAPNHDWETPRADPSEHGWNTPKLSESPLSSMTSGPNGIMESMRTPSVARTPSSATPSMTPSVGKSAFGTPTYPATPSLSSPSRDNGTPLQDTPGSKEDGKAKSPSKGTPGGKRDGRRRIGRREIEILEDFFHKNPHPERSDRLHLSELTNLEQRTVQIWFQNRRAKTRALKMPPSRADTSEEANHYRAAAAAASNAAATALSKRRSSPHSTKSKTKSSGGSIGSASSLNGMGIESPSMGRFDEKGSPFANDPYQRSHGIASPLSSTRGSASARGKAARAPLTRSRSSTTSHGLSRSMSAVGYGYTGQDPNALNLYMNGNSADINNDEYWGGGLSGYPQTRPHAHFQRTSSAGSLSGNSSLGGLENIPENSAHDMSRNMWQGSNISPSSSNAGMAANSAGYHQQLPTHPNNSVGGPQAAAAQSALQQRMQQLQRLQQLKQLKHKSHFSLGGGPTRERSMSMYEQHTHFSNDEIDADFVESSFNPSYPSRSGSITSLASIGSAAIPPSPRFESHGQLSPEGNAQNSPDVLSIPWGGTAPGAFINDDWRAMHGRPPIDNHWSSSYQEFPSMHQQQQMYQQQMNTSGGGRGGLAASAAAAALKGSQHRNSIQSGQRSRQPSVRLQMDENSNSAQLVEFLPDDDRTHQNTSEHSPGRAEGAAKRLIGERVAASSNDQQHPFSRNN